MERKSSLHKWLQLFLKVSQEAVLSDGSNSLPSESKLKHQNISDNLRHIRKCSSSPSMNYIFKYNIQGLNVSHFNKLPPGVKS